MYVGVYIGEAVSAQIAVAFSQTNTPWNTALKAIGIVGIVVAVLIRLLLREPHRQTALIRLASINEVGRLPKPGTLQARFVRAVVDLKDTIKYILRMHSFWLLTLSASFRQLSGNIFGYYMPTYVSLLYPSHPEILSRYGIIVGVVGSVTVLLGGVLTVALWERTKLTPLYLTAIGGMISSLFVLLMVFSRGSADGGENSGIRVLYGTMSAAYLSAELWLGAVNSFVAFLLPPRYKTFGLSIWAATQVLIYSSGPEIIGLALRNTNSDSPTYLIDTRICLAVMIPLGYWIAGCGFLLSIPLVKKDLNEAFLLGQLTRMRKAYYGAFAFVLGALVISLFVSNLVYKS